MEIRCSWLVGGGRCGRMTAVDLVMVESVTCSVWAKCSFFFKTNGESVKFGMRILPAMDSVMMGGGHMSLAVLLLHRGSIASSVSASSGSTSSSRYSPGHMVV